MLDEEQLSQYIGAYLRSLVNDAVERTTYALLHGKGIPAVCPFTREKMPTVVPAETAALSRELSHRYLHKDTRFMATLATAIAAAVERPVMELLQALRAHQMHDPGGPDPEFVLQFPRGDAVQLSAVLEGFGRSSISDLQAVILANWPRNAHGYAACQCCGYHTLTDAPTRGEMCPVCRWENEVCLDDPYNMAKWGYNEPPPPGTPDPFGYRDADHVTIDVARKSYKRCGAYDAHYAEFARLPQPDEQPRYDWSKDARPYWPNQPEK